MTTCEDKATERVKALVHQMAEQRLVTWSSVPFPESTLRNAYGRGKITIRTLAKLCDVLGFDLIINVRDRHDRS